MTTVTAKCLVESKYAENSQTTQYTATAVRTIIDKFTASNNTASAATLAINLVPSAGSAGASNLVYSATIAANTIASLPELVGQILNAGDFVSTLAGTASAIVVRISGREVA